MRIAIDNFRGEIPRAAPRTLPESAAQAAVNTRLLSGDLTAWKQFEMTAGLANTGPVMSLSRIADTAWLSFDTDVDMARGTTGGDATFRTYLTGPDEFTEPRFTTLALATGGAAPYPSTTRPLGVPAPDTAPTLTTAVAPSDSTVTVTDTGFALGAWTVSAPIEEYTFVGARSRTSKITQGAGGYEVLAQRNGPPRTAYAYRDFGTAGATNVTFTCGFTSNAYDNQDPPDYSHFGLSAGWWVQCDAAGSGLGVGVGREDGDYKLFITTNTAWDGAPSVLASADASMLTESTNYIITVTTESNTDGTISVTASVSSGSTTHVTATARAAFTTGGFYGFGSAVNDGYYIYSTTFSNFQVSAVTAAATVVNVATSYVFTFVNDMGQESAPSPPSATILRPDGVTVTVTTPTAPPSGFSDEYNITKKWIYRAVTGSTGTAFQFVAEVAIGTADYDDTLADSALGAVLASDLWVLPPADLKGILALPNGVMAGFSKNQLCLSAQNYPHAWPIEYRLNTDTDIVAIGNVDNAVVIGTQSHVYVAVGNDPAAYSMSKSEAPYACVSKRSLAYLTGVGVVFAGTDGVMAVAGIGQVRNLTESVFTLRQWQALAPSSITAVAHNEIYWMAYDTGTAKGCYALDTRPNGFGVVQMAFHFTAAWVDPKTDTLYMVLDEANEPDDASLPEHPSMPVYLDGTTVYEFDGGAAPMTYRWRSKLWLAPPMAFAIAQVRAESYDNLLVRFYANGAELHERVVTEETEFVLPMADAGTRFEIEILGTDSVQVVQMAEDVTELV